MGPFPRSESRRGASPQHLQPLPPPSLNSLEATRIDEAEEHERCLAMEKRAVLLRSLGVVDAVYRLLSGSPGVEPSGGLPKKMIIADRERARQQSLAKPIEIILPQFPNSSTSSKSASRLYVARLFFHSQVGCQRCIRVTSFISGELSHLNMIISNRKIDVGRLWYGDYFFYWTFFCDQFS